MILLVWIVAISVGTTLLVVGQRGRKIDDHPICRRCGFDLTGKPETTLQCAECGADLEAPLAIVFGHRERRKGLMLAGLTLLIPCWLIIATLGWFRISGTELTPWKPAWLLQYELDSTAAAANIAAKELIARLRAGQLDDARIQSIVTGALERQKDTSLSMDAIRPWLDFIDAANSMGKVRKEDWFAYGQRVIALSLDVRPTVRLGERVPIHPKVDAARASNGRVFADFTWKSLSISDHKATMLPDTSGKLSASAAGSGSAYPVPQLDAVKTLTPGEHAVQAMLHVRILSAEKGSPVGEFDLTISGKTNLVAADAPLEFFKIDESKRKEIESTVNVEAVTSGNPNRVNVTWGAGPLPMPLSHRVYLRLPNAQEFPLSYTQVPTGMRWGLSSSGAASLNGATAVDVIIKPDMEAVMSNIDMTPRWGGEFVFRDVKVNYPPPPATLP